ncbi:hypothetical protein P2W68_04060 [Chryseobacterium arthrosphaerae]|uniref:hypothetical protein n=1 Tax=Chryseobacterium arthrosphaerae TaxID=651561 RepID=UPI0023E12F90|nr:hypothetical protein [Chryseobacterium arthrosphaerae]WES98788.1 hypothetical protein P2W68_04060 [Chryseobacterium arthrosphaerae]
MDRIFRLMGNSKREEMLDFGGGGYNMFGGYGRATKAANVVENAAEVETNIPTILGYNIEEIGEDFAIFSFEGNGEAPDMTIYTNLEPQGTHANAKVDIIPTKVLSGEIRFKSISYYGQRATGKATGRVQNSKKFEIK